MALRFRDKVGLLVQLILPPLFLAVAVAKAGKISEADVVDRLFVVAVVVGMLVTANRPAGVAVAAQIYLTRVDTAPMEP